MDISLMFFPCEKVYDKERYQLMLDAVKFADKNGFTAVWLPERHFHSFGGISPNPAVLAAALAVLTENIELRAGSIVSPIHDIVRVTEEWSVVDNLSKGRIGLSFATGWNKNDFIFYPNNYQNRHKIMLEQINQFHELWQGRKMQRINGEGEEIEVDLWPKPYKNNVPTWISVASNPESYEDSGAMGYNILTHFVSQNINDLENNITNYKTSRKKNGFDLENGKITLMLHCYINDSLSDLYQTVESPFKDYLKKVILFGGVKAANKPKAIESDNEFIDELTEITYKKYLNNASLIGTSEQCINFIRVLEKIGVTEIAALIDFGINHESVMNSLLNLSNIKNNMSILCNIED